MLLQFVRLKYSSANDEPNISSWVLQTIKLGKTHASCLKLLALCWRTSLRCDEQ